MHDEVLVLIPLSFVMIPIIAIVSSFRYKSLQLRLQHQRGANSNEVDVLRKRLEEMENRILTLQDIVISGDYEVQRRLRQREAEIAALHSPGTPQTVSSHPQMMRESR